MKNRFDVIAYWVALSALLIGALALPPLFCEQNDTRNLLIIWMRGQVTRFTTGWRSIDATWSKSPPGQDVAVVYRNFHPERPGDAQFVQENSHRGVYTLLPRRLYTTYDGTIVSGGESILDTHFDPTTQWLMDRHIETVFYHRITEQDSLQIIRMDVPRQPTREQANQPPLAPPAQLILPFSAPGGR